MTVSVKRLLTTAVLALSSVCGSAWAQQSTIASTGLGQAWPNATDVSSSPRWHVYVFERDGIRYVQVNDLNGTVRGAFAVAGGQFLALPIGTDAQLLSTPQQPRRAAIAPHAAQGQTIYQDNAVKILATPQSQNRVMLDADCGDPAECSGGRIVQ
jgi:hypothetical protein